MQKVRKWSLVFIIAFGLNLIWENLHAVLYIHYQGGEITRLVLLRAAFIDALMILGIVFLWSLLPKRFKWQWLVVAAGVVVAVVLERWALGAGRWAYKDTMWIIPILNTGITPTIQLGITGFLALRVGFFRKNDV